MRFVFPVTSEGDGTTFNNVDIPISPWAGRWGDFYAMQRYPLTWRIRKFLRSMKWKMKVGKH